MPAKDLPIHAQRLSQITEREGIAIREDTLDTDHKGEVRNRLRKRADKTLQRLRDPLSKVLEKDEVVLYVAPAQAPISPLQQLTLGWMTYYLTRVMLVATNRRLLAFRLQAKSFGRWEWGRRLHSIRFGDLAVAKIKGILSRYLHLHYTNGRNEKYWGIRGADGKKLRLILEAVMPGRAAEASEARGPVTLCPTCFAAVPAHPEKCAQCGQLFAAKWEMWQRSILFPGGGYFYVGQTGLGVLDAIVETFLIGWMVLWLLVAAGAPEPLLGDLEPYATPLEAFFIAIFIGLLLVVEKLMTGLHGSHFVNDGYPLSKPPSRFKWMAWGLAVYGAIGLVIWSSIPWNEQPVAQVDDDLRIYRADFGLFTPSPTGELQFTPGNAVPMRPGANYGIVLRFRTSRPSVRFRSEFEFEGMEPVNPEQAAKEEEALESAGGLIARYWEVLPNEPEGQQTLNIYLDGVLVRSFHFTVR